MATEAKERQEQGESLLTVEEQSVIGALADAWNRFLRLEVVHSCEQREFCAAVHAAQTIIMSRPVQREVNTLCGKTPTKQKGD